VLTRITGELEVGALMEQLTGVLSTSGFLEDAVFEALRQRVEGAFAAAAVRPAAHAGTGYPGERAAVAGVLDGYFAGNGALPDGNAYAIAAPHVSPEGGWRSYATAYRAFGDSARDATFVVLGTSHYGAPERFGLTRKPYVTPLGAASLDLDGVEQLAAAAPAAIEMEDYCHAFEHSIEFQVLFLQHRFGPDVRVLPILCGPFLRSLLEGGLPEDDVATARFFTALGELADGRGAALRFVLGVDMAHVGRRYGDAEAAHADAGPMRGVAERDRARLDRVTSGDAAGFWALVAPEADRELKWCGSSALYTFLKSVPTARGELLSYEQWNIDPQSVVSFAAVSFGNPWISPENG
jgi:AmmeMemoRadiSam system protein B